jgi:hypothetical protein
MHQPPSNHARIHGFSDGNRYRRGGWYGMGLLYGLAGAGGAPQWTGEGGFGMGLVTFCMCK